MFTLNRSGNFTCAIKPGTPHCGPDDEPLRAFSYRVLCYANDDCLDENGFLVDNMAISSMIEKNFGDPLNPVTESCEKLALHVALSVAELIPRINSCEWIEVTLEPFTGASITYHWDNARFHAARAKHKKAEEVTRGS